MRWYSIEQIAVAACISVAALGVSVAQAQSPPAWTTLEPGFEGGVSVDNACGWRGDLYVTGEMDQLFDGTIVNHIARWNPITRTWSGLGGGLNTSSRDAVVYQNDNGSGEALYVGGLFTYADGIQVDHIAIWDGGAWSALAGGGTNGSVRAFAVGPDGGLYVGGDFSTGGGAPAARIARYDGGTGQWSTLGTGIGTGTVWDLQWWNGKLYVAGNFSEAGGSPASLLAVWDPNSTAWSNIDPNVPFDNEVFTLEVHKCGRGESLYVGGRFTQPYSHLARWDGSRWHDVGGGTDDLVTDLLTYDDGSGSAMYVSGYFTDPYPYIAKWDCGWSPVGTGNFSGGNAVRELCAFDDGGGDALIATGFFTSADGVAANSIARWGRCAIPGDVNHDGAVDLTDLGILLLNFGKQCP